MGALHARNAAANSRLDLAWIVDSDPARAKALADEVGARTATLDAVLASDDVVGVIIASSTDALLANSAACLAAGKAVFCEKPLCLSLSELLAAKKRLSGPLFIAFNRRFDPHFAALKVRLDAGEIGGLETLHLINHDPAAPALAFIPRSGGLFKDFTVHDFDTASWLLNEPIDEVFASASCLIDSEIAALGDVDTAKLILKTRSGRLCLISNSRRTGYGYDQRIEAFGSTGALRVDNVPSTAVSAWSDGGACAAPFHGGFSARYADAYRLEIEHFANMIELGEAPRTGLQCAAAALRLAEAAEQSMRTGRNVTVNWELENA